MKSKELQVLVLDSWELRINEIELPDYDVIYKGKQNKLVIGIATHKITKQEFTAEAKSSFEVLRELQKICPKDKKTLF